MQAEAAPPQPRKAASREVHPTPEASSPGQLLLSGGHPLGLGLTGSAALCQSPSTPAAPGVDFADEANAQWVQPALPVLSEALAFGGHQGALLPFV